jgi:hypothetical protein
VFQKFLLLSLLYGRSDNATIEMICKILLQRPQVVERLPSTDFDPDVHCHIEVDGQMKVVNNLGERFPGKAGT